jgi:hypothetical protein
MPPGSRCNARRMLQFPPADSPGGLLQWLRPVGARIVGMLTSPGMRRAAASCAGA